MIQNKKILLVGSMILALAVAVTGCGGSSKSSVKGFQLGDIPDGKQVTLGDAGLRTNVFLTAACLNGAEANPETLDEYKSYIQQAYINTSANKNYNQLMSDNQIISAKASPQAIIDLKLRKRESVLLSRGFSYNKSLLLNRGVVASIEEGADSKFKVYKDFTSSKPKAVEISATCKKVGSKCYLFVENGYTLDENYLQELVDYFDQIVYGKVTSVFAKDRDTDGDSKLYIVLAALPEGLGGYFNPDDKFPYDINKNPDSNERDIFYMTIPKDDRIKSFLKGVLAHEFQHMVNFDYHLQSGGNFDEQLWLNETMSEVSDFICTQDNDLREQVIADYLQAPISLTLWAGDISNYAAARLFGLYLHDRFYRNDDKFFNKLIQGKTAGIKNITTVTGVDFNTLFKDWMLALCLSNRGLTNDSKYNYTSLDFRKIVWIGNDSINTGIWLQPYDENVDLVVGQNWEFNWYPYQPLLMRLKQTQSTSTVEYQNFAGNVIAY